MRLAVSSFHSWNKKESSWKSHLRSNATLLLLSVIGSTSTLSVYLQFQLMQSQAQVQSRPQDDTLLSVQRITESEPVEMIIRSAKEEAAGSSQRMKNTQITNMESNTKDNGKYGNTLFPVKDKKKRNDGGDTNLPSNRILANHHNKTHDGILIWNPSIDRKEPCDIPCEYTRHRHNLADADACVYELRGYAAPNPSCRFSIYMQMEGEHYYKIRLDSYHLENSYRWEESPLLKPYFEWIHYSGDKHIQNPPVAWNATVDGASFIAKNCRSRNGREKSVKDLRQAGIRVDGLSSCLGTKNQSDVVPQAGTRTKINLMKPYKFHLAFENGNVKDYVTEKVYEALASGVVPVYLGAPNIADFVPDGSIINVADFEPTEALAEHLKDCMENETLWDTYQNWRFRPLHSSFIQRFNFTTATTECRTCRYMYALQHGWGWDKVNQRGIPPFSMTAGF